MTTNRSHPQTAPAPADAAPDAHDVTHPGQAGHEAPVSSAVELLRQHNAWRRGADIAPTDPTALGLAIETVVNALSAPQPPASELSSGDKRLIPPVKHSAEAQAQGGGEVVAGTTLRFGMGALIVNTGTFEGEHAAVFIDAAPEPGSVGAKAPAVPEGTTPLVRLVFPTREQAAAVCDALVSAPPSAPVGVDGLPGLPCGVAVVTAKPGCAGTTAHVRIPQDAGTQLYSPQQVRDLMQQAAGLAQQPAAVDGAMVQVPRWFLEKLARDTDDIGMPKMSAAIKAIAAQPGGDRG